MSSNIYGYNDVNRLLGCICNDTSLILNDKYPLKRGEKGDFSECLFHRIIFGACYAMTKQGAKEILPIDIDMFIQNNFGKENYVVFEDNNGIDYITTIKQLSDVKNYDMYYNVVRKYSLLRQLEQDYNIIEFWDKDKSDEINQERISKYTLGEIIDYFDKGINKFKRDFLLDDEETSRKKAGENGHQILLNFKDKPTMGLAFESKYLTTLWDGCQKQQMYIRSGDTSSGKSRSGIGDLGCLCAPEIYDLNQKKWIENPNGKNRGLYIGCEMQLDSEVDPLMWAYISGIDSSTIMRGRYTEEEKKIIDRAIDVVNDDCMWLVDMPSFNIQKLENEIKQYKLDCNIDYVCFDYMLINNSLVKEFSQSRGGMGGFRGDEVLLELSKALKDICKRYSVALLTMTQVNADIKDFKNRDYQVLRGGKAVADKATGGSISMPITQQELKLIEPYLKKRGFENKVPNFVETVYKARWSEYPKECKIFSYYNLGNMRKEELFVTDKNFMPIKLEKTIINVK